MENNEKNITLEEMKKIEVDILSKIDEICKKNNLIYSLMDGSLLGAVRHKGFIPWDDDIDIMMPRPDYEKLKKIMIEHPIEGTKYMSSDTQQDYYPHYAKVVSTKTIAKEYKSKAIKDYGVFVDIFPIDGICNSKIKRKIIKTKIIILRFFRTVATSEGQVSKKRIRRIVRRIFTPICKIIGFRKFTNCIEKVTKKYDYTNSEYVTLVGTSIFIEKGMYYKKQLFEKTSYVPFENKKFRIIDEYDRYLTDLFGDYMTPPPKEEQKTRHNFDYLKWKE